MIGCSLRHRGEELLVQRGGLGAWRGTGRSFGLPLLHPWANRLRDWRYAAGGRAVTIDRTRGIVRPTSTACRSTARSPRPRTGTWSTRARTTVRAARRRRSTTAAATTGSPCSPSRTGSSWSSARGRRAHRHDDRRGRRATTRCRSPSAGIRGSRCRASRARSGSSSCRSATGSRSTSWTCRPASAPLPRRRGAAGRPRARRPLQGRGGRALRDPRRRPRDRGRMGGRLPHAQVFAPDHPRRRAASSR